MVTRKPKAPKPEEVEAATATAETVVEAPQAKAPTLTKHEGGIVSLDY